MSDQPKNRHLTVRLPAEVRARVADEAAKRRWSLNTFVLTAVEEKLKRDTAKGGRRRG